MMVKAAARAWNATVQKMVHGSTELEFLAGGQHAEEEEDSDEQMGPEEDEEQDEEEEPK